jgi:hypothetical protein
MTKHSAMSSRLGRTWYASMGVPALAALTLLEAQSTQFVHGEELVWAYAYIAPLIFGVISLALAVFHLVWGAIP